MKYELDIDWLLNEVGELSILFSKGHHEDIEFLKACKEFIKGFIFEEFGEGEKYLSGLKPCEIRKCYAKNVSCFEDNKYLGRTLINEKEIPENGRGWFPITKIEF